jgi:amino-acid N-acetyltransferase
MHTVTASLQPARLDDHGAVTELLRQAGLPVADLEASAMPQFLLAVDGGRLIGAIGVEPHGSDGLLRSLVVDPNWRGHGVGGALVQAAEEGARARGLQSLWLLTTDASEYFARHGYAAIDRARAPAAMQACSQFQSLCPVSAACLRKLLD